MRGCLTGRTGDLVRQLAKIAAGPEPAPVPIWPMLVVEAASVKPWSSATFEGERITLDVRLRGNFEQVCAALDRLCAIDGKAGAEFDLAGAIVAEVKLSGGTIDESEAPHEVCLTLDILTVVD